MTGALCLFSVQAVVQGELLGELLAATVSTKASALIYVGYASVPREWALKHRRIACDRFGKATGSAS